jgi:hypothetical protein
MPDTRRRSIRDCAKAQVNEPADGHLDSCFTRQTVNTLFNIFGRAGDGIKPITAGRARELVRDGLQFRMLPGSQKLG